MRFSHRHVRLLFAITPLALLAGACGNAADAPPSLSLTIAEVQGNGPLSPLEGQQVSVSGVVTGDFQDSDADEHNRLGGFYVQSVTGDGDPDTSDAVFVFDGDHAKTDVSVGDLLVVEGRVQEHFGETQIVASTVDVTGTATVKPIELELPFAATSTNSDQEPVADLEAYEGMLIRLPQRLVVTELHNLERYGVVSLAVGGRMMQFTNANTPSIADYEAHREERATRRILLDDGQRVQGASPIRYLLDPNDDALRIGSSVAGVVGVLRYSRDSGGNGKQDWRIEPVEEPAFRDDNPRPSKPVVGGSLRVASFNVQNMFSRIDDGTKACGPRGEDNCRGADSALEYSRQLAKTTTALAMIDADIVGLVELENNAAASLQILVDALNERFGDESYAYLDTGVIGDDAIKTGFIFKVERVAPAGSFAILNSSINRDYDDSKNRPVLAQTFTHIGTRESLTVAVNHLKSKGSDCDDIGDPNIRDGQGNCNKTRTRAAAALAEWLLQDPTNSGDPDILIIGDLNAHLREDPLTALMDRGFENLLDRNPNAYSFVFDGESGALDHALVTPELAAQVVDVMEWHINADESRVHDYNLENQRDPGIFEGNMPFRASDHDPIIIGINLN